jgi:hypothetical protein
VAKKIMEDDPPRPSAVVKSISPVFDGIVSKALAKKQANRYASAREFADAVRGALGAVPATAAVAPAPEAAAPASASKAKPAGSTSEAEVEFWKAIQNSTDAAEFEFYLEQFPEGMYAALARHKIAKLRSVPAADAASTVRLEAEAAERERKDAEERARRDAAEKARQEAEARAKKVAEELAQRQAMALAKLKQQEAARKAAAVDPEATVALPRSAPPAAPAEQKKSFAVPALIGAVVLIVGVGAFVALNRKPAPVPVAETPAPAPAPAPKPEVSAADIEKIRKETEERIRREYADKSAAEQAAAAKAATEKAVQEKQLAAKAAAEKQAAARAAAEKAAAEKAMAEKLEAARRAGEQAALEKAAADRAAAVRVAADKAAAEKAAAEKASAEKAAAEKLAAAKAAAAEKAGPSNEELLEKFIQRHGRDSVVLKEPPNVFGGMRQGEIVYVNDGSCGTGKIREVVGGGTSLSTATIRPRMSRCISLKD